MELLEELEQRGLLQDQTPGLKELLQKKGVKGYAGFDPTSDSLHIGNLVPVMLLTHFQRKGNFPVVLVGGATGMIGDPSGKSLERKLLSAEEIANNLDSQKKQLEKFLDFKSAANKACIVNNFDWFKEYRLLDFLREVGKHITVSYMMAKDSVKNRLQDGGISYAEFTYQLIQGYDFCWLNRNMGVGIQMGGSDQWGNMLTGIELIRRMDGREAHAFTAPLITKADGSKFGKSEGGNVWLAPDKTSPYKFYQYWLNVSDEDASRFARMFSLRPLEEIAGICESHAKAPHERQLQKALSAELTARIHSESELKNAIRASSILFSDSTRNELLELSDHQIEEVFADVPSYDLNRSEFETGISIVDLLSVKTGIMPSKGEARRILQSNGINVNKEKAVEADNVGLSDLIRNRYLIVQKGRKNYYLVRAV